MTTKTPKNGLHTSYFDNGQKKSECHYKDGKLNGNCKFWYQNNNLERESHYKDSKLEGKWTQWYSDKNIALEGSYKDGMPEGIWLHYVKEKKGRKPSKRDADMRYWKFIVNAGVRYGEVLDEKNNGIAVLKFSGNFVKSEPAAGNKTRKIYEGVITINNKDFDDTRHVFEGKQLITFHPISNNPEAFKNKLGGLVDYLMYSGKTIDKKRLSTFYHQCYLSNPLVTAGELIERDMTDRALRMLEEQKRTLTAEIRNEILSEIRDQMLVEFEQTNTPDVNEIAEDLKDKMLRVESEKKLQKNEKDEVESSGKNAVNLVESDILVKVETLQYNGHREGLGNLCTRLTFENGSHKYMKLSTWDQSGQVTEKAKTLIGKHVTTTCWNPVGTFKWTDMGYFKNIYEV